MAVGDIDSIKRTASLRSLIDQTLIVEKLVKYYPRFVLRYAHDRDMEIKPNRNTMVKR